jgi:hypothetical protein
MAGGQKALSFCILPLMVEKQTYKVAYPVGVDIELYSTYLLVVLPIYSHPRDRFDTNTPVFAPRSNVPIIPVQIDLLS